MAKNLPENSSGGYRNLSVFVRQVSIVPGLAAILLLFFYSFFGFDLHLLQTNLVILSTWLILVFASFWYRPDGAVWREYRWIVAPAVLILLFLFDTSWAQSRLATQFLEKSRQGTYSVEGSTFHVAAPDRILFDTDTTTSMSLWMTCAAYCEDQMVILSTAGLGELLFAIQGPSEEPLRWQETLNVLLSHDGSAVPALVRQPVPGQQDQTAALVLMAGSASEIHLDELPILLEGRQSAKIRAWKKNLLETSSVVVSLIVAVFAGVKQFEEEKKRKRADEIKQALDMLEIGFQNDFSNAIGKCSNLVIDWEGWDTGFQTRLQEIFTRSSQKDFWNAVSDKGLIDAEKDIESCLKLCTVIYTAEDQNVPSMFKLLDSALRQDSRSMLLLLKQYPESTPITKQIARNLPPALKNRIPEEFKDEFLQQIILIKDELGFIDLQSFPLQEQFFYYGKWSADPVPGEDRLSAWLKHHGLDYSPFLDAASPHTLVPGENRSARESNPMISLAPTGLTGHMFENPFDSFVFSRPWDASAGLFEYARNLPPKLQNDMFVVHLTPTMAADFGLEQPREIFLHALAEQWMWVLSESPARYYSLKETHRALLGRLFCWHTGSPSGALHNLEEILSNRLDDEHTKTVLKKMGVWLNSVDKSPPRREEIVALIEMRPFPAQLTLLLVSSVDWWMYAGRTMTQKEHEEIAQKAEWLKMHGWALAHFKVSNPEGKKISLPELEKQCRLRIQVSSNGKLDAFEQLFAPHSEEEPADLILAQKAGGSPGEMVRLGQKLLEQHVLKNASATDLLIDDLITFE